MSNLSRFVVTVSLLGLATKSAGHQQHLSFSLGKVQAIVAYCPGGQTAAAVKHQTGATLVIPGGYFGLKHGRLANVDLTIIAGKKLAAYRRDCARPILAFGAGRAAIFGSYASFVPHAGKFPYVLAGDSVAREKDRRCWRSIVGLKGQRLHFLRLLGSYKACLKRLQQLGIGKYLFMDGGSSLDPAAKSPSHIVILSKKSP